MRVGIGQVPFQQTGLWTQTESKEREREREREREGERGREREREREGEGTSDDWRRWVRMERESRTLSTQGETEEVLWAEKGVWSVVGV